MRSITQGFIPSLVEADDSIKKEHNRVFRFSNRPLFNIFKYERLSNNRENKIPPNTYW